MDKPMQEELLEAVGKAAIDWEQPLVGYIDTKGTLWRPPDAYSRTYLAVTKEAEPLLLVHRIAEILGMDVVFGRDSFTPLHVNVWLKPRKGA